MNKIKIESIKLPNPEAVRRGRVGQNLVVIFTVESLSGQLLVKDKFKCEYIQEHSTYDGIPGTWREHLVFAKLERGSVVNCIDCSGEFLIPHKERAANGTPYVVEAFSSYGQTLYRGDDPRYLKADEKIVRQYLIEPFVQKYF